MRTHTTVYLVLLLAVGSFCQRPSSLVQLLFPWLNNNGNGGFIPQFNNIPIRPQFLPFVPSQLLQSFGIPAETSQPGPAPAGFGETVSGLFPTGAPFPIPSTLPPGLPNLPGSQGATNEAEGPSTSSTPT